MRFFLLMILSLPAWAQNHAAQNRELELVQAVSNMDQALSPDFNKCDTSSAAAGADERIEFLTVRPTNEDNPPRMFKVKFDSIAEVPAGLRSLAGEAFDRAGDGEIEFVYSMPNDDLAYGMWALLTKSKTGDDDGPTHGAEFQVGRQAKGFYWRVEGETNIYTKTIGQTRSEDGTRTRHKNFTEENAIRLVLDNMKDSKSMFYEVGVGWRELNSENVRPLMSGWQMERYHGLISEYDSDLAYRVNLVPNKEMGHDSGVEGFVGLGTVRDNFFRGGSLRVRSLARVRAHSGQLADSNYYSAAAETTAYYQTRPDGVAWRVGTGIETERGRNRNQTVAHVDVGVARNNGALTLSASQTISNNGAATRPMVIAPTDDDTIWTMEFRCKVRRGQRCRPFEGLFMGRMRR